MAFTPEERRERELERKRKYYRKHTEKYREYYQKNRERILAKYKATSSGKSREWYQKNRERILLKYKTTYQPKRDREKLKRADRPQPDHCEICGKSDRRLVWDHSHQRGHFRGWICDRCNMLLGCADDDPNYLRKLIAYLERTKKVSPPQLALSGM